MNAFFVNAIDVAKALSSLLKWHLFFPVATSCHSTVAKAPSSLWKENPSSKHLQKAATNSTMSLLKALPSLLKRTFP